MSRLESVSIALPGLTFVGGITVVWAIDAAGDTIAW